MILVPTNECMKNYRTKSEILSDQKLITHEKHTKIEFESDDDLPLKKTLELITW